jgi:putative ABC transport system permease protein
LRGRTTIGATICPEAALQDLRLAVRALRATPVVTAVAIVSLALGIGANTAIFSLINSLLLRPLPVTDPPRLVTLSTGPSLNEQLYSYKVFDQIRQHRESFDGALAWVGLATVALTHDGETQIATDAFVSGDYFTTLGVPALLGRTLTLEDDVRGGGPDGPVTVISYGLWQRRFGGAASVIGSRVTVERALFTIVGVTPPDFFGVEVGRTFDVALPVRTFSLVRPAVVSTDDDQGLRIMLRLKPGQSLEAANAAIRALQPAVRASAMPPQIRDYGVFLKEPWRLDPAGAGVSPLRQRFEQPLVMILIVVLAVLLIAGANLANLLLARGAARRHELSVRVALGASRWRLARQSLIESLLMAGAGTIVGLVVATWASRAIVARLSTTLNPVALAVPLDTRVLVFTAATLCATTLLFGFTPALRAMRVAPIDALREHGRTAAGGGGNRLSNGLNGLLVAQVAFSLLLVMTAGLFVQTFDRLERVSLGFDRDRVLVVTLSAPTIRAVDRNPFYHQLVKAVAAVPGVAHTGGSLTPPLISQVHDQVFVTVPGPPRPDVERISRSSYVTPGWLAAYGTAVRAGRDIDERDSMAAVPVIVVNEAFVRRFFPNRRPIGAIVPVSEGFGAIGEVPLGSMTIVGIVADAIYSSIREPAPPTMYIPLAQAEGGISLTNFYIAVRPSVGSPALLARSVAAALTAVNPDVTIAFRPLGEVVDESLAQDRLVAILSGFFGALALLLAGLGLYGVTAYAVARRRAEIGLRMALGAAPVRVIRLVLARVSILVGLGVAIGVGASLWASRFMTPLLFGLEPRDPATLIGAAVTLAAVGAVAGWLPAWRASRIEPAEVLREG